MSDGKSEALELDLDSTQQALAILSDAMHQLRMFRHLGADNHQSAHHLMAARNRISDARAKVAEIIQQAGIQEDRW